MINWKLVSVVLVGFLSSALLQGCAQTPERSVGRVDNMALNNVQKAPELNNLSEGDLVEIYSGILAPFGKVTIGREYYSASGRLCKQILSVTSAEIMSIACSVGGENWYVRKPLGGRSKAVSKSLSVNALLTPTSAIKPE